MKNSARNFICKIDFHLIKIIAVVLVFNLGPICTWGRNPGSSDCVYHGSRVQNLKGIKPNLSTHGASYVYAASDLGIAASFIVAADDFDFAWTIDENGIFSIVERYPGAFELYKGLSGSIYTLSPKGFLHHQTSWDAELVSTEEAEVIEETQIEDVLAFLKLLDSEGKLKLYYYPDRPKSIPENDEDLIEKALDWMQMDPSIEKRFLKLHPDLESSFRF